MPGIGSRKTLEGMCRSEPCSRINLKHDREQGSLLQQNMTISISKEVLAQELAGETVLLDLASESYFGLDAVGTRVWQLLNEGMGQAALIDTLLDEYEVERAALEQDIADLLRRLAEAGLITFE